MIFSHKFYPNQSKQLEQDPNAILQQQMIEEYIDDKMDLYNAILRFLNYNNDNYNSLISEKYFQIMIKIAKMQKIEGNRNEMRHFLQIIKNIVDNHHRDSNFVPKINKILQYYKYQIKRSLSNLEIFHIFKNNKILLLLLFQNEIITISETIYNHLLNKIESNGIRYCYFFYPEIEKFVGEEKIKDLKNEILSKNPNFFDNYEKNRQEGENDSYICSLIRQDSVEEFISYVNRTNFSISSQIEPSIFETNSFLIDKKPTLIEYSAFFGAIQIFQYLILNNVELMSSLWFFTIHSKNPFLIHLLESNEIFPPNILKCFIESIKCHHNEIADYIENNLFIQNEYDQNNVLKFIKYYNYAHFQTEIIDDELFFYLCFYNYNELVNFLLKKKENEIEATIIQQSNNLMKK